MNKKESKLSSSDIAKIADIALDKNHTGVLRYFTQTSYGEDATLFNFNVAKFSRETNNLPSSVDTTGYRPNSGLAQVKNYAFSNQGLPQVTDNIVPESVKFDPMGLDPVEIKEQAGVASQQLKDYVDQHKPSSGNNAVR